MAETKPKGDPVFLTIAGKKVTLPGVTSLNTDDELSAAANDWIAKNYEGPEIGAPVVFRTPKMDEKGGFAPGEEIVVRAQETRPFEQPLLGAAAEAANQVIGEQLGFDPSTMAALSPDQSIISQFNRNLLQTAQPVARALEAASAAPTAALSGLAQLAYNLGITNEDPRRTAAAAEEAINVGLLPLGTMTGPRIPTARELLRETQLSPQMRAIAEPTPEVPTIPRSIAKPKPVEVPEVPVAELPPSTPATGKPALAAMEAKGQTTPLPELKISDKVANFASDYVNLGGLQRPADMPFSEFFYRHFKAGTLPEEQVADLVKKYDLNDQDLFELVTGTRQGLGDAARVMQRFSIASRYVPKEAADIAKLGLEQSDDLGFWKRFTNAYRGALVSNVATTMRNNISTLVRVPIDVAVNLTDTAINAALNPFRAEKVGVNPMDAFAMITDRFKPAQNQKFYENLRNVQPEINKELAATYASDVARVTKKDAFAKVEKAVDVANLLGRVSETATRKAVLPVMLRREATKRGLNFDELVQNETLNLIPQEGWAKALDDTLGFTYSARSAVADGVSKILDKMGKVGTVARVVGTTVIPFPRFMMNAMKFQFDYSPAGFTKLLSKTELDKIAKGEVSTLSKAMVGSSLLYGAYQFRNSENAGEKWYEGKLEDGRVVDLRPYFPAAPYLLVADIIKRAQDGTLDQAFETKDILQGLTGAQFRAGTGLYVTDQLLKDLSGASGNLDKAKSIASNWLADVGAGFLTPFQQFKDFYAQYNPEEAVFRDAKESPLGTLLRPVPGAQQALGIPAAESPTREGPMTTESPALRQLLGATIRPAKNIVESELDRLGLTSYDVGSKTGEVAIDRLINRDLGIIAERGIVPLLQSPQYQQLDDVRKSAAIKEIYAKAREAATAKFTAENPELALLRRFKTMKREEKIMLNQQVEASTGMKADELLRQLSKAPLIKSQEQYDALPNGTQYTDPGDYKVYTKGE